MSDGKKGVPVWVWVLIAVPLLLFLLGIGSALALYGVRKYISAAKEAEATAALTSWGDGLVRCAASRGGLPDSAGPVPASLGAVSGHKYQSASTEWAAEAHTCAGFNMSSPQYFQYSWSRSTPNEGVLDASADINGDGAVDSHLTMSVSCVGGKCVHGAPVMLGSVAGTSSGVSPPSTAGSTATEAPFSSLSWPHVLVILATLAMIGCGIWLVVVAFQVSVPWGLITWFVPCGGIVFAVKHWDQAKKPILAQLAAFGAMIMISFVAGVVMGVTGKAPLPPKVASAAPASTDPPGTVVLPPLPSAGPLPAFDGSLIDVSSVMGRARKLANEWEPEAALLGLEATVQSGKIQPQLGGKAKLTFGPSPFAAEGKPKHTGLFVVTYDQSGIHGAPEPGKAGATLAEPMCAPEAVLLRVSDWGTAALQLRYGLDSVQRPSWLISPVNDPKQLRIFEPQACAPRGSVVVRPRR